MSGDTSIGAKFWALAKLYAPELVYHGAFRFRVRIVHADNRLTIDPVKATWLDSITLAQQWPGVGGVEVKPQVGAECVVCFLDSDSSSPIVTQWLPARAGGGIPVEVRIGLVAADTPRGAARKDDQCTRLAFFPGVPGTVAPSLWYSDSTANPYTWAQVAATIVTGPLTTDAGTPVKIDTASAAVLLK